MARVLQRAPRPSTSDVARLLDDPVLALRRAALAVARRDLDPALEPRLFEALAVPATGSAAAAALAPRGTAILPRLGGCMILRRPPAAHAVASLG